MVLVDKLLYNKLNSSPSTLKPDIHVHQTSSLNPFPTNPHHTPPTLNSSNPHPNPPHNSKPTPPNSKPSPPISKPSPPISKPSPPVSPLPSHDASNEWESQAHQWIDTFQQPNYMDYIDMDKSVQMEENPITAQREAIEYTNTPQRAFIPQITTQMSQPNALPQESLEQQMEIEYNQTPSIANEIKKAVEQEKKLHIEYAPPLLYPKPAPMHIDYNNVQKHDQFGITHQPQGEQQMELGYNTPHSITHNTTPLTLPAPPALLTRPAPSTIPATSLALTAPPALLTLPAPSTLPAASLALTAPPTLPMLPAPPAPLSLTHMSTKKDSSNNEDCEECENTIEYEKKLPITHETNASKAMIPYDDYITMGAKPKRNMKKVFYTCTRCNTNFLKQSSLINHNNRFHAAFKQIEKGEKRKSKDEELPGVPLLKRMKVRGVKRKYKQNSGSNKEIVTYKPYAIEKAT